VQICQQKKKRNEHICLKKRPEGVLLIEKHENQECEELRVKSSNFVSSWWLQHGAVFISTFEHTLAKSIHFALNDCSSFVTKQMGN
jgi:hypothetical protein